MNLPPIGTVRADHRLQQHGHFSPQGNQIRMPASSNIASTLTRSNLIVTILVKLLRQVNKWVRQGIGVFTH